MEGSTGESWDKLFSGPDLPSWPWAMPFGCGSGGRKVQQLLSPWAGSEVGTVSEALARTLLPPPSLSVFYNTTRTTDRHL